MPAHPSSYHIKFTFGKYKGHSIGYVQDLDPSYLEWMASPKASSLPTIWREAAKLTIQNKSLENTKLYEKTPTSSKKNNKVAVAYAGKGKLAVELEYDAEFLAIFKLRIDGRKWNSKIKVWEIPQEQIISLVELVGGTKNVIADDKTKEIYKKEIERKKDLNEIRSREDSDLNIPLLIDPYPYQKVAVEFVDRAGGRAMIADDMGVGKSAEALCYSEYKKRKTLIVCPKSVVVNWSREIKKFTGKPSCVWTTTGTEGHKNCSYHIINYDIVDRYIKDLNKCKFDLMVCDEATALKNRRTKRAKSVLGSWKERRKYPGIKTKDVIFLTGTPILNRPTEAYSLLSFLDKNRFNNFYQFVQRYGGAWGIEERNLDELHERTKDLIIRRTKEEILPELPRKQRNDLYIEMTKEDRAEYRKRLEELFAAWNKAGKPSATEMPRIQSFLYEKKMERTIEMVDELLEHGRGILIFSVYIDPLKKLKEHYGDKAALLYGAMSDSERQESIDRLTKGDSKVGLFSIGAGSMGIDGLQYSMDMVLFLNMWWTPAIHQQAEDRLLRIGQSNKVQVYYMLCENTIDEYMKELLDTKLEVIEKVVDGRTITAGTANKSFFKEFVKKLQEDYYNDLQNVDTDVFIDVDEDDLE